MSHQQSERRNAKRKQKRLSGASLSCPLSKKIFVQTKETRPDDFFSSFFAAAFYPMTNEFEAKKNSKL
jgi:hypothetical protein